jgi:hypothetical protein
MFIQEKENIMRSLILATVLILVAAFSRLIPHPANFTPLAAMALVGGAYLDRRFALAVPFAALILSDAIIGFHSLMPYVYGSFLAIGGIGLLLQGRKRPLPVLGASLASSVLFFVVTNFGVWISGSGMIYPRTATGLAECYTLALPFFRNTITGDLVYTALLFGVFEFASRYVSFGTPVRESAISRK